MMRLIISTDKDKDKAYTRQQSAPQFRLARCATGKVTLGTMGNSVFQGEDLAFHLSSALLLSVVKMIQINKFSHWKVIE